MLNLRGHFQKENAGNHCLSVDFHLYFWRRDKNGNTFWYLATFTIGPSFRDNFGDNFEGQFRGQFWGQFWIQFRGQFWRQFQRQFWGQFWGQFRYQFQGQFWGHDFTFGPSWAGYSSYLIFLVNRPQVCRGRTLISRWIKPLLRWAGLKCGYSSVEVTPMPQTFFQISYRSSWTGYTPAKYRK